jgi:membrane-associated phospholipid phosphatase
MSASLPPNTNCFAFMSVSIPFEFFNDPVDSYAVFLSFIPWFVSLSMILGLFVRNLRHIPYFRALCSCYFFCWLSCDGLKPFFRQPRPIGTCLSTYGMPSAHSSVSIGMIMMLLLQWRSPASFPLTSQFITGDLASGDVNTASPLKPAINTSTTPTADSVFAWIQSQKKIFWIRIIVMFNCALIPWSRVHLMDHSVPQTIVGSILGFFVSICVFGWFSRKHKQ